MHPAGAAGRVLIDGRDVGEYSPKWLKRHVALVSQEPVLYARSIRRCELLSGYQSLQHRALEIHSSSCVSACWLMESTAAGVQAGLDGRAASGQGAGLPAYCPQ